MVKADGERVRRVDSLLALVLVYGAASLIHHIHNAVYLYSYPNMPVSLSSTRVYLAWSGVATIGFAGYLMNRRGQWIAGLLLLGIYGALGLYGLLHYALAPMSAHTLAMNATIWLEVSAATALLIAVTRLIVNRCREIAPG